jgi:spectinomycin phosphotransferase
MARVQDVPDGVTEDDLVAALAGGWGIDVASVTYLPVGAGSYHWAAVGRDGRRRFVTVDRLGDAAAFATLTAAFDTALALHRNAGLGFVVAPVPAAGGATVVRLADGYGLSVYPWVDGVAGDFGPHPPEDRAEVLRLLGDLHGVNPVVAPAAARLDLVLPGRDGLDAAIRDTDRPWSGGPYAEPARHLLAANAGRIGQWLDEFDELADRVPKTGWVVTHGEPHPGNLIREPGGLRLVDWDTVRIAPPERDLWMLDGGGGDPLGLALFRQWWTLADVACYVDDLRRPHRDTADAVASWTCLNSYF